MRWQQSALWDGCKLDIRLFIAVKWGVTPCAFHIDYRAVFLYLHFYSKTSKKKFLDVCDDDADDEADDGDDDDADDERKIWEES